MGNTDPKREELALEMVEALPNAWESNARRVGSTKKGEFGSSTRGKIPLADWGGKSVGSIANLKFRLQMEIQNPQLKFLDSSLLF